MAETISPENNEKPKYDPVAHLRQGRFEYSDEIPDRIIHSTDPEHKFKVRKGWFHAVIWDFYALRKLGTLSPELEARTTDFESKFGTKDFTGRPTTAEDISEANALIDDILAELKLKE